MKIVLLWKVSGNPRSPQNIIFKGKKKNTFANVLSKKQDSFDAFLKQTPLLTYKLSTTIKFTHLKCINHYCFKPLSFGVFVTQPKLTDINYILIMTGKEKRWMIREINSFCTTKTAKSISGIIIVAVTTCNSQIVIEFLLQAFINLSFRALNNQPLLAQFLSPQILRNCHCALQWCWGEPRRIRLHHFCSQRAGQGVHMRNI